MKEADQFNRGLVTETLCAALDFTEFVQWSKSLTSRRKRFFSVNNSIALSIRKRLKLAIVGL